MDAWEAGIFDDDLAADVRADWEAELSAGASPAVATRLLVQDYADEVAGSPALAASFWIALAALQLDAGAVDPDVRDRAVRAIARGEDLERWARPGYDDFADDGDELAVDELAERRHATAALRAQLLRGPVADAA
ncbi:hypothetical protein [Patulibacter sp. SYSU D01012]|uniref:hypothetical protein n=1 Tax=Patulibacter sp. SYSU D01012 TaxID=2817381 RepID=UPI001B317B5F|nr:hypothetical protein [Patulibacter sp. SYSU D01012]